MKVDFKSVDDYLETFPKETQSLLVKVREIIIKNAPKATESISYGMPAYKTNGKPLVYFAAFKNHIGFLCDAFPGMRSLQRRFSKYKQGKGSVQFSASRTYSL